MATDRDNLNPHKAAVAAMYLFGARYAGQRGGAMDFWEGLSASEQGLCERLVSAVAAAREDLPPQTGKGRHGK